MKTKKERVAEATQSKTHNDVSTKRTQIQVVLDELKEHPNRGITSWDMIVRHRITRTAAHVCVLKKMGHKIESKIESKDGKNYSRYWLKDDSENGGRFDVGR